MGDVGELAASIGKVGVLQPVTVAPRGKRFVLVYGHRRLAATRQTALTSIPAIVQPMTEVERIARRTVENLHRKDLTPCRTPPRSPTYATRLPPSATGQPHRAAIHPAAP